MNLATIRTALASMMGMDTTLAAPEEEPHRNASPTKAGQCRKTQAERRRKRKAAKAARRRNR